MKILGIDLETTGLDTGLDRITELGFVLWDTETKSPLVMYNSLLCQASYSERFTDETIAMMKRVSGITVDMLVEYGVLPHTAFRELSRCMLQYKPEYVVAHNAENFDKPMLIAELARADVGIPLTPWIDTKTDLPFEVEPDSRKLKHLALDAGFVNPFPHRAVFDVLTMLKVMSEFPIDKIVEYSKIPWVTVRALVEYEQRELAKARRFSWENIGDKKYPKCWVKRIKENQLEKERAEATFKIVVI